MEEIKKQYLSLLSEIIAKEVIVLGSDMAILRAQSIAGLSVDNNGEAIDIKGNAVQTLQELVYGYMELSGEATKDIIDPIFINYPQIKKVD